MGAETSPLDSQQEVSVTNGQDQQQQQEAITIETYQLPTCQPPPEALPPGWVVRHSHSNPGYFFHFHQETGICQWEIPSAIAVPTPTTTSTNRSVEDIAAAVATVFQPNSSSQLNLGDVLPTSSISSTTTGKVSTQSVAHHHTGGAAATSHKSAPDHTTTSSTKQPHTKKQKTSSATGSGGDETVRVLHILKKHKDSRNPKSWRNPNITLTKYQADQELQELLSILKEVANDPKELRATFEELARTESDCSSSKRGGDLGFFGRKKMQPTFEKASFGLSVGEMSDIVDTSSGVHVILRLG